MALIICLVFKNWGFSVVWFFSSRLKLLIWTQRHWSQGNKAKVQDFIMILLEFCPYLRLLPSVELRPKKKKKRKRHTNRADPVFERTAIQGEKKGESIDFAAEKRGRKNTMLKSLSFPSTRVILLQRKFWNNTEPPQLFHQVIATNI